MHFGHIPSGDVAIEKTVAEHEIHAFDAGCIPHGDIPVERRLVEHADHRANIAHIPLGNIPVELRKALEQAGLSYIPTISTTSTSYPLTMGF